MSTRGRVIWLRTLQPPLIHSENSCFLSFMIRAWSIQHSSNRSLNQVLEIWRHWPVSDGETCVFWHVVRQFFLCANGKLCFFSGWGWVGTQRFCKLLSPPLYLRNLLLLLLFMIIIIRFSDFTAVPRESAIHPSLRVNWSPSFPSPPVRRTSLLQSVCNFHHHDESADFCSPSSSRETKHTRTHTHHEQQQPSAPLTTTDHLCGRVVSTILSKRLAPIRLAHASRIRMGEKSKRHTGSPSPRATFREGVGGGEAWFVPPCLTQTPPVSHYGRHGSQGRFCL